MIPNIFPSVDSNFAPHFLPYNLRTCQTTTAKGRSSIASMIILKSSLLLDVDALISLADYQDLLKHLAFAFRELSRPHWCILKYGVCVAEGVLAIKFCLEETQST